MQQLRVDHAGGVRKPERLLEVYRRFTCGEAGDEVTPDDAGDADPSLRSG